jgi:tetratricopeptide (TPR) repeat protein
VEEMKKISYYETLLDQNKPALVLKDLAGYRGKDGLVYFIMAEAKRLLGHFEPAIALYNKAIELYKIPAPGRLASAPSGEGAARASASEGRGGRREAGAAAQAAATQIDMQLALAKCYRTLGRAQKALQIAKNAHKTAIYYHLKDFAMQALQEEAMAHRAAGSLKEAANLLNQVLAHYKKEGDLSATAFALWGLGGIARLEGRFQAGKKYFEESIKLAQKAGDKAAQAYGLCALAGISRVGGDIKACVANYRRAEAIFKHTDDIFGKAYTNCGMANGLRQLGRLEEALKRYAAADKLYSSINDKVDLGFVKWGRADILRRQNKLQAALGEFKAAQKLFANSDEIRGQLLTDFALAQTLYAAGRAKQAEAVFAKAYSRAKKEGLHTHLEVFT